MKSILTTILCLFLFTSYAQEAIAVEKKENSDAESYKAKMIQTSRMNMEYMDFGGDGKTLIHIQGVHNASALKDNMTYFQNYIAWRNMLAKASGHYRVYAPIYRGYGNSDQEGDNIYKVENIAKDILAFMDEMKIESATLIGRTTAPQVMFYIAEHYPNRVDAMIAVPMSMYKTIPINNNEIRNFLYYCSYAATDLGDRAPEIDMPSYDYEPIFYNDDSKKIDIPLYWPYSVQIKITQMNLQILNYLQPENGFIPNQKAKKYFDDLYANNELQDRIRQYYVENDPTQKNMEALKRAFGDNLTLKNIDEIEEADMMKKFDIADEIMMEYLISLSHKK